MLYRNGQHQQWFLDLLALQLPGNRTHDLSDLVFGSFNSFVKAYLIVPEYSSSLDLDCWPIVYKSVTRRIFYFQWSISFPIPDWFWFDRDWLYYDSLSNKYAKKNECSLCISKWLDQSWWTERQFEGYLRNDRDWASSFEKDVKGDKLYVRIQPLTLWCDSRKVCLPEI